MSVLCQVRGKQQWAEPVTSRSLPECRVETDGKERKQVSIQAAVCATGNTKQGKNGQREGLLSVRVLQRRISDTT